MRNISRLLFPSIISIVFLTLSFSSFSQTFVKKIWDVSSRGKSWDYASSMSTMNNGTYICGIYNQSTNLGDFSKSLTEGNGVFVSKIDEDGKAHWLKSFLSSEFITVSSLVSIRDSGGFYICGKFSGEISYGDITIKSQMKNSVFIAKMSDHGDCVWIKNINGGNFSHTNCTLNSEGSVILSGSFIGSITVDDTKLESDMKHGIYIINYDNKGYMVNSKTISCSKQAYISDINLSSDHFYFTGSFCKSMIIDGNLFKSKGSNDAFLFKLDNKLNLINFLSFGGAYNDYGTNIQFDLNGDLIWIGSFSDEITKGAKQLVASEGNLDVFIVKLDTNFNLIWADNIGGKANEYAGYTVINSNNDIYLSGTFRGSILKDKFKIESEGLTNDVFLAKYSNSGELQFIEAINEKNSDFCKGMSVDTSGFIYIFSDYSSLGVISDSSDMNNFHEDFNVTKWYDCTKSPLIKLPNDTSVCDSTFAVNVTEGFNEYYWNGEKGRNKLKVDRSGVYIVEVVDDFGCSNVDTIVIELNNPPNFSIGDTLFANTNEHISLFAPTGMYEYCWNTSSKQSFINIDTKKLPKGEYHYSVDVIDSKGCKGTDDVILVVHDENKYDGLIENENDFMSNVSIYPNPAIDKVNVSINNLKIINTTILIEVVSVNGQLVVRQKIDKLLAEFYHEVDISQLDKGSYYLKIFTENELIAFKKIVKL